MVFGLWIFCEIGPLLKNPELTEKLIRIKLFSLDAWRPRWRYSGGIAQFFSAPNHALPG